MKTFTLQDIIIIIKSITYIFYINFIINLLILLNDKYLYYLKPDMIKSKNINVMFIDSSDEDEDENTVYTEMINSFNINNILEKYNFNKEYINTDNYIIVNSFIFDYFNNKAINCVNFTNKLSIINKIYGNIKTSYILDINQKKGNYIFILYMSEHGYYNISIIDLKCNKNVRTNEDLVFKKIIL